MAQHRLAKIVIGMMALGAVLHAQPAQEHLRRADEAYRARQGDEAYLHLLRAIAMDPINYEAQWKASRSEVDLAEASGRSTNDRLFDAAEMHAQAAVRLVRNDPGRIIHRLELAGIYADRGDKARARQLYMWIASAALVDPNDDLYKRQAADRSRRLGT